MKDLGLLPSKFNRCRLDCWSMIMTTHCQAAPLFLYVLNLLMLILSVEDWQGGVRSGKTTLWRQLVLWEGMFCQAIAVYRMKTKMLWMPTEPLVTTDSLTNCFHWWWGGGGRRRWRWPWWLWRSCWWWEQEWEWQKYRKLVSSAGVKATEMSQKFKWSY